MGLFDVFKKKEEPKLNYDPLDVKVTDLQKNFVFEYDLKSWVVKEVYDYDWGNNFITREYKVDSGDETAYLSVDEDDEIYLYLMKKVNIRAIDEDLPEQIVKQEVPPKKLTYDGKTFFKGNEHPGYFHNTDDTTNEWSEFILWDYYDESEKFIISIEQWGEREFEAAYGKVLREHEISNIIPAH
jgi:hypothetical protein